MQCYQAQTMRVAPLANAKQNFTVSYIHTYIQTDILYIYIYDTVYQKSETLDFHYFLKFKMILIIYEEIKQ